LVINLNIGSKFDKIHQLFEAKTAFTSSMALLELEELGISKSTKVFLLQLIRATAHWPIALVSSLPEELTI